MTRTRNLLLLALVAVFSFSLKATEHNGYIVKFHSDKAMHQATAELKQIGEVELLNTSVGDFAHLKTDQKNLKSLESNPNIAYVEPNWIIELDKTLAPSKNDKGSLEPRFNDQWGLKNTGDNSGSWWSSGKAGEDVNAEEAWNITKGDREVVVAVIDTGVDHSHQDIKGNSWVNEAEKNGIEGVDDDGNGFVDDVHGYNFVKDQGDPTDGHGHGTHCAGVIGASHNSEGVAGVMDNVRIMGLKFLSDSGRGDTKDAIRAIDYAVEQGADVLSNSWGGGKFSQALKDVIQNANEKGVVFVAAAGNSRADNDSSASYPANYDVDNVISVGAMGGKGTKASFSNHGDESVHVFAPGVSILSSVPGDSYKEMSGTSMAAPFVSGGAGLLLASEPNLTAKEVRDRVMDTAVRNGSLGDYTLSGRMDIHRMLENLVE